MYMYEYREKYDKFNIKKKKLEQPRAENRESNYGSITLSQKK